VASLGLSGLPRTGGGGAEILPDTPLPFIPILWSLALLLLGVIIRTGVMLKQ
jgi:hypothetical protein